MKILKLSPYYFPEQESGAHLTSDLEEAFVEAGFDIINYCPTPTRGVSDKIRRQYKRKKYEEFAEGHIEINRFAMYREGKNPLLRAVRYILVNLIQYHKGVRTKDVDAVFAGSTPPTQGLLCGLVAQKLSKKTGEKIPFIYYLQDVFPDSLITAGLTCEGSLLWKIGRKVEAVTYRKADVIIVISEDIKRNIMEKGVPENKIRIVRNWIDANVVKPVAFAENTLAQELGAREEDFKVVYAGNLGLAQGVSVLIDAAERLKDVPNLQFYIFGKGAEEEQIYKQIIQKGLTHVRMLPLQPIERVPEVYSLGDVCVITCKKGIGRGAFPSKTASILATATPVVASFDLDSELCQMVTEYQAGACVEPEDAEALADTIKNLYQNRDQLVEQGRNGRKMIESCFSKQICTGMLIDIIRKECRLERRT